jgi:hypothetical protein
MVIRGLATIIRSLMIGAIWAWDYIVVATYCVLAMTSSCTTTESEQDGGSSGDSSELRDGSGRKDSSRDDSSSFNTTDCPAMYGPQRCESDQECRDSHDGGNWYCDQDLVIGSAPCGMNWPECARGPVLDADLADDAGAVHDGAKGK